jgi:hypothetical protein
MTTAAWRARAAALPTDLVLLGVLVAAAAVAASFTSAIPAGLGDAPEAVRAGVRAGLLTPAVVVTATLAALYAGFDYTLDLKNGVVARETVSQRRLAVLGARATMTAVGGGTIGLACISGIVVAAAGAGAGWMLDPLPFLQTAAVGALASLWGFAVAVLVRRHLVALFVVPATLGAAVPLATALPAVAAWLPLPVLVGAVGADETVVVPGGPSAPAAPIGPEVLASALDVAPGVVTGVVAAGWIVIAASAAVVGFTTRDLT